MGHLLRLRLLGPTPDDVRAARTHRTRRAVGLRPTVLPKLARRLLQQPIGVPFIQELFYRFLVSVLPQLGII